MQISRFDLEVSLFAEEMLKTLNNEKNRKKKSDLSQMDLSELVAKYREERAEFEKEINRFDVSDAPAEAVDLANTLMMIYHKIKLKC